MRLGAYHVYYSLTIIYRNKDAINRYGVDVRDVQDSNTEGERLG